MPAGQLDADVDLLFVQAVDEFIDKAADLTGVARRLRHAFLVGVEFLQHHHRQEDVVFIKAEDGGRIVHQDVGVEHEDPPARLLGHGLLATFCSGSGFGG